MVLGVYLVLGLGLATWAARADRRWTLKRLRPVRQLRERLLAVVEDAIKRMPPVRRVHRDLPARIAAGGL